MNSMESVMKKNLVSIVRYEKPGDSVKRAVSLAQGFDDLPVSGKIVIKPNIVFWTKEAAYPKWGVITTSRVIEDLVILLKEHGADDISICEGTVTSKAKDLDTIRHAFETLGYNKLKQRYGVKVFSVFERPFEKVDLGAGVVLNMNSDALNCDFFIDVPVLKAHAQTVLSLGIKNLKGLLDIESRKKCHQADPVKNLHYMVARLANKLPPTLTLLDGIFSAEFGPGPDGKMRRSNLLIASRDIISVDKVGAKVMGYEPKDIPYLAHAMAEHGRPQDLSDVEVAGERVEDVASLHQYQFPYNEDGTLPKPMEKMGIKGLSYPKYDLTICTYCSGLTGIVLTAISQAWKGQPWDEVEILTGKHMKPTPGKHKTILLGKCMYDLNKDDPNIKEMIAVKGCPPSPQLMFKALRQAGIDVNASLFENIDQFPALYLRRYKDKPEFDEAFFRIT